MQKVLVAAIGFNFRNTTLGLLRIRRNLKLGDISDHEVETLLKSIITSTDSNNIESKGKNYYFKNPQRGAVLTINKHSLTIITAKLIAPGRIATLVENGQLSPS